jgi:hypothetical protein
MKTLLTPFALLLLAASLLVGCGSAPLVPSAESFEGRPEKAALAVLRNVEASDEQRAKILAAFDRDNPKMLKLDQEWEEITRQWEQLNRADPKFLADADALSARRMDVAKQQIVVGAAFEHEVASVLTPDQWKDWKELWALVGEGNACGPGGRGGGRRR